MNRKNHRKCNGGFEQCENDSETKGKVSVHRPGLRLTMLQEGKTEEKVRNDTRVIRLLKIWGGAYVK